ncbi:MAG: ABC transporter ATP-binding protein [Spirochaetes bacterium]|nr:ABC transporter ATP-binding protein [Spirochaetota bacterium]
MTLFRRPLYYLLKRRYYFAAGIISLLLVDIFQLFIPRAVKKMIDDLFALDTSRIHIWFSHILLLALGMAIFRFFWRMLLVRTSFYIEEQLRNDLYKKYLYMDQPFFDRRSTGSLIALATNDLQAIRMMFSMGVVSACDGIFLTILSVVFMFSMNSRLTLYVLIPLPIITFFLIIAGKKIFGGFTRVQEYFSDLTGRLQEYVSSIVLIKNFTLEDESIRSVEKSSVKICDQNFSLMRVWGVLFPLMALVTGIAAAFAGIRGGTMTIMGELSLGEFTAFFSYISILAWPMMAIGWVMNLFQRGRASMKRINDALDADAVVRDKPFITEPQCLPKPTFELKDVSFTYPEALHPALKNISMIIPYGCRIGITGKTGSGKSTLADLLLRRYDPSTGSVLLNGQNYRDLPVKYILSHIKSSPQQNTLFADTLRQNIVFGSSNDKEEQLRTACNDAELSDTVNDLPKKLDTMLGEKGVNLSGGQKQRVALARLLLSPAPLCLIDDSLSALDSETEKSVYDSLLKIPGSMVIISHRVSAISNCDIIYVLDEGTIAEKGTHEELVKQKGLYSDIYTRQLVQNRL